MKRFLVIFVALILLLTAFASGCSDVPNESYVNKEPRSFKSTNIVLVDKETSDYKIVVPENATTMDNYAASELQYFIQESTGCLIEIINDSGLSVDNSNKYLSIGNTKMLLAQQDIVIDAKVLGDTGATVITKGNTVYMAGAGSYGTLYSVYKFLYYQIGFKAYAFDSVTFDYYNKLELLDFSYQYAPTIEYLVANDGELWGMENMENSARMFVLNYTKEPYKMFEGKMFNGYWVHTMMFILPSSEYPEYYKTADQICFTDEGALQQFCENVYPTAAAEGVTCFNVGVNDNVECCRCEECERQYAIYGGPGGVLVRFLNRVTEYIENRFVEDGITKKLDLVTLAYYSYVEPPVVKDENGKYVAVDESVIPRQGQVSLGIEYTPIGACFHHSFEDKDCIRNATCKEQFEGWNAITDNVWLYTYGTYFGAFKTFYNNFSYFSEQYKYYDKFNVKFLFDESCRNDFSPLSSLRVFLRSSFAWNANQDLEVLIDDFFANYYGAASDALRDYYDALIENYNSIYYKRGNDCAMCFSTEIGGKDNWSRNTLATLRAHLEKALYDIEKAPYSEKDKQAYKERIHRELFFVRYNEYQFYSSYMADDELLTLKQYVEDGLNKYNFPQG